MSWWAQVDLYCVAGSAQLTNTPRNKVKKFVEAGKYAHHNKVFYSFKFYKETFLFFSVFWKFYKEITQS